MASSYATRAVIVSTPDPGALRDGQHTASLLLEKGIEPVELVVNRVSRRLLGSLRSNVDDIMDSIGLPLLGLIPEDQAVPVAAAHNSALVLRSRKGAAVACLHISRRLLGMEAPLMHMRF